MRRMVLFMILLAFNGVFADEVELVRRQFYKPGKLVPSNGTVIEADAPCLLRLCGKEMVVSDPTHTLSTLRVSIGGKRSVVKLQAGEYVGQQTVIE